MNRYVVFLRGVTPVNLKMADLKRCLELAEFSNIRTILSSGNAAFDSRSRSAGVLEREIEAAMTKQLDRSFYTIVPSVDALQQMVDADPFSALDLPAGAKRVVTFARRLPQLSQRLPLERDGARILAIADRQAFSAYVP